MLPKPTLFLVPACLVATLATAQSTQPYWSTYFGQGGRESAWVVKRGPGNLLTIAGHTDTNGLATSGAYRTVITGPVGKPDGFVAQFDPSLPAAQQLKWCTYFGGDDIDLVFDAAVDAQGNVTIVGLTLSDASSFPLVNGFQTQRKGASDGFVARINWDGTQLLYSTYFGGTADDRINALAMDASGVVTVAGVTEGPGFPLAVTAGTVGPTWLGGTDAFAARIDPAQSPVSQLQWATYIGGYFNEGTPFANWLAWGGWGGSWAGNVDAIGLAVEPSGSVVVATPSQTALAPTTPGCLQPVHGAGGSGVYNNVYLVRLSPGATLLQYGTFFGGLGNQPRDVVLHPAGGYIVVGFGIATNMKTTPNCFQPVNHQGWYGNPTDGFVCWIDPAAGSGAVQLRYSTYFGGNGGEDGVLCAAVESSGIVTIGGYVAGGGNAPITPGCLQSTLWGGELGGFLARLAMNGNGKADLLYSTYLGNSWTVMTGLALDDVGDPILVGASASFTYPTNNAYQTVPGGSVDAVITHMPLMSGGTTRFDVSLATPACTAPLYHGIFGTPDSGNSQFGLTATNAPPSNPGLLAIGFSPLPGGALPIPGLGINLLVVPSLLVSCGVSDALGFLRYPIAIPASLPPGLQLYSQWAFLTNTACPGSGPLATSEGLLLTTR